VLKNFLACVLHLAAIKVQIKRVETSTLNELHIQTDSFRNKSIILSKVSRGGAVNFLAIRKSYLQITASFPAPIPPQDDIFFLTHILKVNFSFLPAVNGIISKKRH
jgi:hypothetical protein